MARFIVIDPSLRDSRGHHDGYARRMAEAAERFGYEIILATHRTYADATLPPGWRLLPIFEKTIYDDPLLMPDWGDFISSGGAAPLRQWHERWRRLCLAARRTRLARDFARGLGGLADEVTIRTSDHILLAAASEQLLAGFAAAASDDATLAKPTWHAMFHFNNFFGCPSDYAAQRTRRKCLSGALAAARASVGEGRWHSYATTGELAHELSSLGAGEASDAGYPIDDALRTRGRHERHAGPLRITFAGDARLEKGFHHLPEIVERVLAEPEIAARVQFVIQASLPFRLPCRRRNLPVVAARESLLRHGEERVRVIAAGQSEGEYRRLILATDIGLLPYDARHYYARCSGVLAEMWSAGIPVVAPPGCWMGSQIAEAAARGAPGGVAAQGPEEMAGALCRMVREYDAFRAWAAENARRWTRKHDATRIVAGMIARAAPAAGARRSA